MKLPLSIDLTPQGYFVEKKEYGEKGYMENAEYSLQLIPESDGVTIQYYSVDDNTFLSEDQIKIIISNHALDK